MVGASVPEASHLLSASVMDTRRGRNPTWKLALRVLSAVVVSGVVVVMLRVLVSVAPSGTLGPTSTVNPN